MCRWRIALIAGLLLTGAVGCVDDGDGSETTETTASSVTTAQEPWDLLYISDSTGWRTGEAYAELAEEQLGVPVRLIDWRLGSLPVINALALIEADPDVVGEAEIVVLWANPSGTGVRPGWETCLEPPGAPGTYTVEDWAPFVAVFGDALDAIWTARDGRPTVLRVTDLYGSTFDAWSREGILDDCLQNLDTMSTAIEITATEHGATMVSALDVYNGPSHDQDPDVNGYFSFDGIHPSAAGGQAMAEALAAAGFEPTSPP